MRGGNAQPALTTLPYRTLASPAQAGTVLAGYPIARLRAPRRPLPEAKASHGPLLRGFSGGRREL